DVVASFVQLAAGALADLRADFFEHWKLHHGCLRSPWREDLHPAVLGPTQVCAQLVDHHRNLLRTMSQIACAKVILPPESSTRSPSFASRTARLVSLPKASATSLATIRSRFLRFSLSRAFCSTFSVSAAKPTSKGWSLRAPRPARMSGVRTSSSSSLPPVFFTFCGERWAGF